MTHSLPSDRLGALRAAQQHAFERAPAIREIYERARMTPQDIRSAADLARLPGPRGLVPLLQHWQGCRIRPCE